MLRAALVIVGLGAATTAARAAPTVDYNRDVRPLLSENCYACHGFDEEARQADLRLDDAASATADRDGVPAIVPGDAAASEVWKRISSDDESLVMPPADSHKSLTDEQQQLIKCWIDEGAQFSTHWSFIPPQQAPLPETSDPAWPRNEIDRFVQARLDAEQLTPAPEADRRTLIRRLYFDLTGLPPSAEEVEAFVADQADGAYERLVDRLLASPHYGERLALPWLDAARYADTNGFSIDGGRHMWLWRDWVIDAFNRNLPYDQFLRDQIAGDLRPDRTDAQLIASGFQRNNMVTHEGGTIPEENLANYNADRVRTLGESVLGLTLGCAQCHDHKFDPVTQRDYYRMFAYFNTLSDAGLDGNAGVNPQPFVDLKTVLPSDEEPALRQRIAEVEDELRHLAAGALAEWEDQQREQLARRGRDFAAHQARLLKVSTPNAGGGFDVDAERMVVISRPQDLVAYDVSMELPNVGKPVTGLRIIFHPDDDAPGGPWGFAALPPLPDERVAAGADPNRGTFVLSSFSASCESVPGDQVNLHELRDVRRVTANSWRSDFRPEQALTTPADGWSPQLNLHGPAQFTVTFAEPIDAAATPFLTAQLNFGYRGSRVAKRFEFFAVTGEDDDSNLPPGIAKIIQTPAEQRTPAELARIGAYYSRHSAAMAPRRVELANLQERLRVITEPFPTMVMNESPQPRVTHILHRGNYASPGEAVDAGTPASLPAPPAGAPANRLGLAQWTTMASNPLPARVAVNRVWQMLFGAGIVRTTADFGMQGAWPTHPELLDWLAVDFVEHGWDVKRLVRQIVTSATYRQSSVAADEALARDPDNELLARGPRFRLPAEFIRDAALSASGLMVSRLGGPSVNPYTPGDLWREISHYGSSPATAQTFVQDHGEKLYRRSIYTYWKRTAPPPNMAAFDAPNRETCVVNRATTTTPLQALVLLNDVQFVEAARALAERIARHDGDDAERLRWAFEECLSRPPSDAELSVLTAALSRERDRYAKDESAAREYLAVGESPRDPNLPPAEHAAWAQVATLIMNLSENVTRN
jgi:hypothetical protein